MWCVVYIDIDICYVVVLLCRYDVGILLMMALVLLLMVVVLLCWCCRVIAGTVDVDDICCGVVLGHCCDRCWC